MGCSPTETEPPPGRDPEKPSALGHPAPSTRASTQGGTWWLMQQTLSPESSMVPWALARAGERETPTGPGVKSSAWGQRPDLTPHHGPRNTSPTSCPRHPLCPPQKGCGRSEEPTWTGFTHPMPTSGCSPGAALTDPSPSSQSPGAAGGLPGLLPPPPQPQAGTTTGAHLQIWPG